MARKMTDEQRKLLAKHIEDAIEDRKWTKSKLAETAGYDDRTVRNILSGYSAKYETYENICTAVGIDIARVLEGAALGAGGQGTAPNLMGGYARKMYEHYLGDYITIRPKYNDTSIIKAYLTRIYWSNSISCYCFEERKRLDADFSQRGHLYIPLGSACMYLMTIDKGWVRTVVVSQMMAATTEMRGLITSQFNLAGPAYAPVSAPIVYIKTTTEAALAFGELKKGDPNYDKYFRLLQETLQMSYARIALPPM